MSFSKEDKAVWLSSEVMQELEKIALEQDVLSGPPAEAFQVPEEMEEKTWEEESDEEKLLSAVEELGADEELGVVDEEGSLKEELAE